MSEAITSAHVSGPLGQALAVVDGETWLYQSGRERRRPTGNDIRFFFDFGLEVRSVPVPASTARGGDDLRQILDLETRRFSALRGLLVGMDPELDEGLRQRGMRRSEGLLGESLVAAFVETRFLRPVEGQPWSISHAVTLAHEAGVRRVARLYAIVEGPWLLRLEAQVREWAAGGTTRSIEQTLAVARAYESGLIAAVAGAAYDQDHARAGTLIFRAQSEHWDPRLVAHLVRAVVPRNALTPNLAVEHDDPDETADATEGPASHARARVKRALEDHDARRSRGMRRAPGGSSGDLDAILKQVDWIADRFQSGDTRIAWRAVGDLGERQIRQGGAEYFAMSLTRIATLGPARNSEAEALLELAALCAPDDPAVPAAGADLLSKSGRLPEALAAYDRTVEQFPDDVVARNGRAETLRALGRLPEALAAYDRTVEQFPDDMVARNGRAVVLLGLGRADEARAALASAATEPVTSGDWVAAHVLCMIDLRDGATPALRDRLRRLVLACPDPRQRRYFESTLAVVFLALKDNAEAGKAVDALFARPDADAGERQVLRLMKAHAEAASGDLEAARHSLSAAANVVAYEEFAARQLRAEIERRYGLGQTRAVTNRDEIAASEAIIIRLEVDAWVSRATRSAQPVSKAA